jgi:hypothetical protein
MNKPKQINNIQSMLNRKFNLKLNSPDADEISSVIWMKLNATLTVNLWQMLRNRLQKDMWKEYGK